MLSRRFLSRCPVPLPAASTAKTAAAAFASVSAFTTLINSKTNKSAPMTPVATGATATKTAAAHPLLTPTLRRFSPLASASNNVISLSSHTKFAKPNKSSTFASRLFSSSSSSASSSSAADAMALSGSGIIPVKERYTAAEVRYIMFLLDAGIIAAEALPPALRPADAPPAAGSGAKAGSSAVMATPANSTTAEVDVSNFVPADVFLLLLNTYTMTLPESERHKVFQREYNRYHYLQAQARFSATSVVNREMDKMKAALQVRFTEMCRFKLNLLTL